MGQGRHSFPFQNVQFKLSSEYLLITGTFHSPSFPQLLFPSCSEHRLLRTVQKELKCSLWQVLCVLPPLASFQSPSNCSFCHPFKESWAAGEKIGKVKSCKCLFWGNASLMLFNGLSETLDTCSWWELFPSQTLALSLWLICSKVTQEKTEPWFFLCERRCICSPWLETSAVKRARRWSWLNFNAFFSVNGYKTHSNIISLFGCTDTWFHFVQPENKKHLRTRKVLPVFYSVSWAYSTSLLPAVGRGWSAQRKTHWVYLVLFRQQGRSS